MFLIEPREKPVLGRTGLSYNRQLPSLFSSDSDIERPPQPSFQQEKISLMRFGGSAAWMLFVPTIDAGEITLRFHERLTYNGNPAFKITADAISSGFLPRITGVSVQDYFESIVDAREFCSFKMTKKTREGKRQRDITLTFDREKGKGHFVAYDVSKRPPVELKNEEVQNIPSCVQDLLSAIYHTRLRDLKMGAVTL